MIPIVESSGQLLARNRQVRPELSRFRPTRVSMFRGELYTDSGLVQLSERKVPAIMIRQDILERFPELFGTRTINGRTVNIEEAISEFARDLGPEIAAALTARRRLLSSPEAVREKYAWPKWDESFEDPVTGRQHTFRQIVQGLIDNFLGRDTDLRWRLNDEVPIPDDAHPTK